MGLQDMYKNMLMKEENKILFLFSHKACMMIQMMTQIQVGLFLGIKMIIQYVLLQQNHIAMTAVKNWIYAINVHGPLAIMMYNL